MPSTTKCVLIVEDEKPLAHALTIKLDKAGYATANAAHGQAAIDLLHGQSFNLIILDLMLPVKDGFQVLEYMRLHQIAIPVIVVTNFSQEEEMRRALSYGISRYFVKSNSPLALIVATAKKLLNV